ncbi:hypothetical protein [Paucibacter sp. KCTC 42545]|uniref:hypothetical protein n=1 Tax=Paucibacter sp. KCTC 42545 TaxID=1768242 RepID=UPI000B27A75A|nr:hypothetical protein [Paucibacter sp. KCTC 42545]
MPQFTSPRPLGGPALLKLRKPRNPLVAPALMRQAGRHGSSQAAKRQRAQIELRQQIEALGRPDRCP